MNKDELVSRHSNARWLPYSLLDEIFALLKERIEQGKAASGDRKREELESIRKQLDTDVNLYLENVERESIF